MATTTPFAYNPPFSTSFNNTVFTTEIQSDGQILVGGDLNGQNWTYLGTGSVGLASQLSTGAEALTYLNENGYWTSY